MRMITLAVAMLSLALPAMADEASPGKDMTMAAYNAMDGADSGEVTIDSVLAYGAEVRAAMDNDGDGKIALNEFIGWSFGMQSLAEDRDRDAAFETALRVIHVVWDLNGDGMVSAPEHSQSLSTDFIRADQDGNAMLSADEYLDGFLISRAMRAAIKDSSDSSGH